MKQLIQLGVVSSLLIGQSSFAINPIQGWYVGVLAGVSLGPSSYPTLFDTSGFYFPPPLTNPFPNNLLIGTVNNNTIGGGGGGAVGFRMQQFRVEGELFYNYFNAQNFQTGNCILQRPHLLTPIGTCELYYNGYNVFEVLGAGFKGSTYGIYGLVNAYYDFMSYDNEKFIVPYVGLGLGGVRLTKSFNFTSNYTTNSIGLSDSATTAAAQGIVGFSYYLDDYAWLGIDYRYLTSRAITTFSYESRYSINTINVNANFSFDNASLN